VPEGYRVSPSSFSRDAVCGEPIKLKAKVRALKEK
jgi:hypothetical protein